MFSAPGLAERHVHRQDEPVIMPVHMGCCYVSEALVVVCSAVDDSTAQQVDLAITFDRLLPTIATSNTASTVTRSSSL
jgi:hypothetical protein